MPTKDREKLQAYRDSHKEYTKEYNKMYKQAHKEESATYHALYYQEHHDGFIERAKQWRRDHPNYMRTYREKNPEKTRAQYLVRAAIKTGSLVRPNTCARCLESCVKPHGHHHDYSKPLEVEWLCPKCHRKEHSGQR